MCKIANTPPTVTSSKAWSPARLFKPLLFSYTTRVPKEVLAMTTKVDVVYSPDLSTVCQLPVFLERVPAGFPSPAGDYMEGKLDLNQYLVKHPAATFFVRVTGDSMIEKGIHSGDILIVDRSLDPKDGNIVIAVVDSEPTVKQLEKRNGKLRLLPANKNYEPVEVSEQQSFEIWGIVTNVIHPL